MIPGEVLARRTLRRRPTGIPLLRRVVVNQSLVSPAPITPITPSSASAVILPPPVTAETKSNVASVVPSMNLPVEAKSIPEVKSDTAVPTDVKLTEVKGGEMKSDTPASAAADKAPDVKPAEVKSSESKPAKTVVVKGKLEFDEWVSFSCPWCGEPYFALRKEIACQIFRCGWHNGNAIPPHASKEQCDQIKLHPNTRGCCMPFQFDGTTSSKLLNPDGSPRYA